MCYKRKAHHYITTHCCKKRGLWLGKKVNLIKEKIDQVKRQGVSWNIVKMLYLRKI